MKQKNSYKYKIMFLFKKHDFIFITTATYLAVNILTSIFKKISFNKARCYNIFGRTFFREKNLEVLLIWD